MEIHDFSDARKGIEVLPGGYRVTLAPRLSEGYFHREMSKIPEISVSASKSQHSIAKAQLHGLLKNFRKNGKSW